MMINDHTTHISRQDRRLLREVEEMKAAMEYIHDLSVPEYHYWHKEKYKDHRKIYITTGNTYHLERMLAGIYYEHWVDKTGGYRKFYRHSEDAFMVPADDWNEGNLFRAPRYRRVISRLPRTPMEWILAGMCGVMIMVIIIMIPLMIAMTNA